MVATSAEKIPSVWCERHRVNVMRAVGHGVQESTGVDLPNADTGVIAAGGQESAIGAEGKAHDGLRVSDEGAHGSGVIEAPEFGGVVEAPTGEIFAVRAERDRPYGQSVS